MRTPTRLAAIVATLAWMSASPAPAQQVVRYYYPPAVARAPQQYYYYPAAPAPQVRYAQPRYYQRNGVFLSGPDLVRRQPGGGIPYTRSPYTDDWSTDRHLPFPKPWMRP